MSYSSNPKGVMLVSVPKLSDLWYIKAQQAGCQAPKTSFSSNHFFAVMKCSFNLEFPPKNTLFEVLSTMPKSINTATDSRALSQRRITLQVISRTEDRPMPQRHLLFLLIDTAIVHADPLLMAAPIVGKTNQIHIICTKEFYNEGKLQTLLPFLSLVDNPPLPVRQEIYEICLRYTIHTKMCPLWNYVEPYLVCGANFLTNPSVMAAVQLQVFLQGNNAHLSVRPVRVQLPPMTLKDLVKRKPNLTKVPGEFFYDFSMSGKKIFVLPRMTEARIETVSSKMPQSDEDSNYEKLKEFWFNKHGYVLPETEEGIFYVAVRFGYGSTMKPLTYPSLCVKQRPLVVVPPFELDLVLQSFAYDLNQRLPGLCVTPVGYPPLQLNSATETLPPLTFSSNQPTAEKHDGTEEKVEEFLVEFEAGPSNSVDLPQPREVSNGASNYQVSCASQIHTASAPSLNGPLSTRNYAMTPMTPSVTNVQPSDSQLRPLYLASGSANQNQTFPMKRSNQFLVQMPPVEKKPKKPTVDDSIDMVDYAQKGLLGQVNMATLQHYLRKNGIIVKTKDKKPDLIAKINEFLRQGKENQQGANQVF